MDTMAIRHLLLRHPQRSRSVFPLSRRLSALSRDAGRREGSESPPSDKVALQRVQ